MGIAIGLIVTAIILFWAVRKGWIDNKTLGILADIAGIVALIAAAIVFIAPGSTPTKPTPGSTLLFIPTNTATTTPTNTLTPTPPSSVIPTPTLAPISEKTTTPTSSSTPSQVTATPTPTISETLEPIQRYTLPLTGPSDIVYDGANLWAVFAKKLVKLESVEDGNRFRAIEQIEIPAIRSLDWDVTRNQYWAISARCDSLSDQDCIEEIVLLNSEGIVIDTITILQPLDSRPNQLVWDGEYLWVASLKGILYKLQANLETEELILDDSFGLSLQWGGDHLVGLAWDETSLWLLDGYILTKLDSSYQPVCRITLPATAYILWWEYSGISWGERYLWVVHAGTNTVYRVDPTICE